MPLPYKILLSLIVAVLAVLIGWMEFQGGAVHLAWIVVAIAGAMIFGLWVFPEAGGGKPERTPKG
jgi:hypothetical protein